MSQVICVNLKSSHSRFISLQVRESGNPKGKKVKDVPMYYEVGKNMSWRVRALLH